MTLAAALVARADFSYTTIAKRAPGPTPGAAARATKQYVKGQKMKVENGDKATIVDLAARTITIIDNRQRTYSVARLSKLGQLLQTAADGVQTKSDVRDTGRREKVNGYDAREIALTAQVDNPAARSAGLNMPMEMDVWMSSQVPGSRELQAFQHSAPDGPARP